MYDFQKLIIAIKYRDLIKAINGVIKKINELKNKVDKMNELKKYEVDKAERIKKRNWCIKI